MLYPTVVSRFGEQTACFVVPLPGRPPVHMSFRLNASMTNRSAIAIIRAEAFVELWKDEPYSIHREQSFGTESTWRDDYKFHHAEQGFSEGSDNPVPLAYVSFGFAKAIDVSYRFLWFGRTIRERLVPHVGFTNGVTRTIWLLANGCKAFPVECELAGAHQLQKVAGVPGSSVLTVAELLARASAA